jgi:hypothetical protein
MQITEKVTEELREWQIMCERVNGWLAEKENEWQESEMKVAFVDGVSACVCVSDGKYYERIYTADSHAHLST